MTGGAPVTTAVAADATGDELPPALTAAYERPWKAPWKVITSIRSGWPLAAWNLRAILIEASIASAPELAKNTTSAKVASHSRAASRGPGPRREAVFGLTDNFVLFVSGGVIFVGR